MAGFINTEKEWRPTVAILEKIRSEGFDTSGLRNLKKMLKCMAKYEQKYADQAGCCKKSLEKIWNKCKDDPFIDDFGTHAIKRAETYSRECSALSNAAYEEGPINHIKQILDDAEDNLKELLHSRFDLQLISLIKQRSEILKEIVLCKQEYHNSCRAVLNALRKENRGVATDLVLARKKQTCEEYTAILKEEKDDRFEFLKLCRDAKVTIMRHELCLFLNMKDAYCMTADWLAKTSVVKSAAVAARDIDGMVKFLRDKAARMNSRQFVEGWKKLHCEEVIIPKFVPYDMTKDSTKPIQLTKQTNFAEECRQIDVRKVDGKYMVSDADLPKQTGRKANNKKNIAGKIVTGGDTNQGATGRAEEKGAGEQRPGTKTKKKLKMMLAMQI